MLRLTALAFAMFTLSACGGLAAAGEACEATEDCEDGLHCMVAADDSGMVCMDHMDTDPT